MVVPELPVNGMVHKVGPAGRAGLLGALAPVGGPPSGLGKTHELRAPFSKPVMIMSLDVDWDPAAALLAA